MNREAGLTLREEAHCDVWSSSLLKGSVFTDRGGDSFLPPTPPYCVPEMSLLDEEACLLDIAAKAPSLTSGPEVSI